MKRATPYILLTLVIAAVIVMFITGTGKKKTLDERLSLRRKDKIPYGTWVAFQGLPKLFPAAGVYSSRKEPGDWDSIEPEDSNQLFIAITPRFMADEYELDKLIAFVEKGNDVFISTMQVSGEVESKLDCSVYDMNTPSLFDNESGRLRGPYDSLVVRLKKPPFDAASTYKYPGKKLDASFTRINSTTTDEIGTGEMNIGNFIQLRAGKGHFYLHLAPMAFTNYFLLYKKNIGYYEKALSVINPRVKKIVWDEYYMTKRYNSPRQKQKSWIGVLFRYPALKAALLTAFFALLLYLLLGMRRKQRYIPKMSKPRNDSLDFVKTIGRLYYEKNDLKNLCRKMATYFLEYVRSKYKLATGSLDESFVRALQFKSGVPDEEIRRIIGFIRYVDDATELSPADVTTFHRQLESFYQKA